jgi:hypothetical protein
VAHFLGLREAAESAVTEKTALVARELEDTLGTSPAIGWGGETSGAKARTEVSPCTKLCKVVLRNCGSVRVAGQSDGPLDREFVRELRG